MNLAYVLAILVAICGTFSQLTFGDEKPKLEASSRLHVISVSGRWGFINSNGTVVIEPKYDYAFPFDSGRALVKQGKRILIFDAQGKYIADVPFPGNDFHPLQKGFMRGSSEKGFQFADRNGQVLPRRFDSVQRFSEGMAGVYFRHEETEDAEYGVRGKWGFVNERGDLTIPAEYSYVRPFSEGLAAIYYGGEPGTFGAMRSSPPSGGRWGFIDKTGKIVISPEFEEVSSFSEGFARAYQKDGEFWGYINTKGIFKICLREGCRQLGDFHHERATFHSGNRKKAGYIDTLGDVIIPEIYKSVTDFSEGVAAVEYKEAGQPAAWGYIDTDGKWVLKPQFTSAAPFDDGVAAVTRDGETGYIDRSGKFIWKQPK